MCVALLFVLVLHVTQAKWLPIERRKPSEVTRELFTDYMNHGKLLVVEGGAADWPALEEWSLQWFVDRFPQDRIQVRSAHSMPYQERPTLTLEEYARWVVGKEDGRHYFSWVNNDEGVSERMIQPCVRRVCGARTTKGGAQWVATGCRRLTTRVALGAPGTSGFPRTSLPALIRIGTRTGFTLGPREVALTDTRIACARPSFLCI